ACLNIELCRENIVLIDESDAFALVGKRMRKTNGQRIALVWFAQHRHHMHGRLPEESAKPAGLVVALNAAPLMHGLLPGANLPSTRQTGTRQSRAHIPH